MTNYRKNVHEDEPVTLNNAEVHLLLEDLCVRLGFCLPPKEREKLESNPPGNVESFARAVLDAEGLSPEFTERRTYRAVRNMVVAAFNRASARNRQSRPAHARKQAGRDTAKKTRQHPAVMPQAALVEPQSAILRTEHLSMEREFTAVIKKRGRWYIAYIEEIPGVNTQGKTLAEARQNLREALQLTLEANRALSADPTLAGARREPITVEV